MKPKVKFCLPEIEEHIENTAGFLNPEYGWDWSDKILYEYPLLKEKVKGVSSGLEKKNIAIAYFRGFFKSHKKEIVEKMKIVEKEWDKINDKFMSELERVLEEKWPVNDEIFIAALGINPICPRDILKRYFLLHYRNSLHKILRIIVHEILHFLWFEKWKSIFPDADEGDLDAPSLSWKLSEIVPLAILSDKRIQKIFKHHPSIYDEWTRIKINNKPLLEHIQEIYDNKENFEDFVIKSWSFVNKYREELK